MELSLKNKNAIVCGSTQGIGEASAIELAKLGANITLIARNKSKLLDVLNELDKGKGQTHSFICIDFSDSGKLKQEMTLLKGTYHILINNTGGPAAGPIADANTQSFEDAFRMHLINNQILVQKVVEGMKKEGFGRIVNIISTSVKAPIPGLGVSNTIRGAVASWAKTLSFEVGEFGITVNNILPGYTDTQRLQEIFLNKSKKNNFDIESIISDAHSQIPLGRFADPKETAKAICFLASEDASYINGINLPVDGGRLSTL